MQGASDFQLPLHYELVKGLSALFNEVKWTTHSQAAHKASIYGSILYGVMDHKRGFLTHTDINALLLAAQTDGLSDERYWFWHEKLHKILIDAKIRMAIYYETPQEKRIQTKADYEDELYYQQEHNAAMNRGLSENPQMIQRMVDSIYTLGPQSWSFVGISLGLYRLRQGIVPEHISTPSLIEYAWHGITNLPDWLDHLDWNDLLTEQIPNQIYKRLHHIWKAFGIWRA